MVKYRSSMVIESIPRVPFAYGKLPFVDGNVLFLYVTSVFTGVEFPSVDTNKTGNRNL